MKKCLTCLLIAAGVLIGAGCTAGTGEEPTPSIEIPAEPTTFAMSVDDAFPVEAAVGGDFPLSGFFVTGHIAFGTVQADTSVTVLDADGNEQMSCTVTGIITQTDLLAGDYTLRDSAGAGDAVALVLHGEEALEAVESGMWVVSR